MTEEEFDLQLTRRIVAYAHTKRLPEDFAGRFVGTLRRRRRVRRAKLADPSVCGCGTEPAAGIVKRDPRP